MTRADLIAGLLLAAVFAASLWEASSFQYGTEFAPGPGFAPVWLSAIGIALSLAIAFGGFVIARHVCLSKPSFPGTKALGGALAAAGAGFVLLSLA